MPSPAQLYRDALHSPECPLKPTVRHALHGWLSFCWGNKTAAHPGHERIAKATGLHPSTVKAALAKAVDAEWLEVRTQGGSPRGGKRDATEYVIPARFLDQSSTAPGGENDQSSTLRRPGALTAPTRGTKRPQSLRESRRETAPVSYKKPNAPLDGCDDCDRGVLYLADRTVTPCPECQPHHPDLLVESA